MKFLKSRIRRHASEVGSHSSLLGNSMESEEDAFGDANNISFELSKNKKADAKDDVPGLEPASPASTLSANSKSNPNISSYLKSNETLKKKVNPKKNTKQSVSSKSPNQSSHEVNSNKVSKNGDDSDSDNLSYDVIPLSLWSKLKQEKSSQKSTNDDKEDSLHTDPQELITENGQHSMLHNNGLLDGFAGDFNFPTNFTNRETCVKIEVTNTISVSEISKPSIRDQSENIVEGLITDAKGHSWVVFINKSEEDNDDNLSWNSAASEYHLQPLNRSISDVTTDSQESFRRRQRHRHLKRHIQFPQNKKIPQNKESQWTLLSIFDTLRDTFCAPEEHRTSHDLVDL